MSFVFVIPFPLKILAAIFLALFAKQLVLGAIRGRHQSHVAFAAKPYQSAIFVAPRYAINCSQYTTLLRYWGPRVASCQK